jgi:phage/plasmid-like protein (TIGR03299 family)
MLEMLANGNASMAWANDVPWHGLGQELSSDATPTEFMNAAGLDWSVSKRPMYLADQTLVLDSMMLARDTDDRQFSVVGADWNPVQNRDVFAFYDRFFEAGHIKMETCGSLKDGKEIWAMGKIDHGFTLPGDDRSETYLLFHSAHLYGKATTFRSTTQRVVCNNTLQPALKDHSNRFSLSHRADFTNEDIQKMASEAVMGTIATMEAFSQVAQHLANTPVNQRTIEEVVAEVYQPTLLNDERLSNPLPLRADFAELASSVLSAYELAPGQRMKSARGTAWGLLNAVTYVEDHLSAAKSRENELVSAWWGNGAKRKQVALDACLRLAA